MSLVIEKKQVPGRVAVKDATGKPMTDAEGKPLMKDGLVDTDEDNEITISSSQERARLQGIYGAKRINKFFPGTIPSLVETFEEARQVGIATQAPTERLVTVGEEEGR